MRVLVTGAAGFIGSHLLPRLADRHEVIALVRSARSLPGSKAISAIEVDLARPLDCARLPQKVDAIIHLAQANVPFPQQANELFAVNTSATQYLLDYGRRAQTQQFILASTGDVYGPRQGPCRETDALLPGSYYGATKHAAELLVNAYAPFLRPCILRFFHPYGPGQQQRLIPRLAERVRQGMLIRLNSGGRPHISPIYVDDVITAFERSLDKLYAGVLNVAGDTAVSIQQLADLLGAVLQVRPAFEETGQEASDTMGDNTRLRQALGMMPLVRLSEGLSRTFARRS